MYKKEYMLFFFQLIIMLFAFYHGIAQKRDTAYSGWKYQLGEGKANFKSQ